MYLECMCVAQAFFNGEGRCSNISVEKEIGADYIEGRRLSLAMMLSEDRHQHLPWDLIFVEPLSILALAAGLSSILNM